VFYHWTMRECLTGNRTRVSGVSAYCNCKLNFQTLEHPQTFHFLKKTFSFLIDNNVWEKKTRKDCSELVSNEH
jgi:hypothetical protein